MVTRARDIMDQKVLSVPSTVDALSCARRMVEARQGYAVVVGDSGPEGIVTEWDYVEKVVASGRDPQGLSLGSIASRPLVSCDKNTPTDEVAQIMAARDVRRIVVTDGPNVIGVVGARDVLRNFREYVNRISSDIARLQPSLP